MLVVALRLKVGMLVPSDKAFHGVTEVEIHYPTDLRL